MHKPARQRLRVLLAGLAAASLIFLAASRFQQRQRAHSAATVSTSSTIARLPATILWAWERPEKLDFLDPQKLGVAFLAKTIYLRDGRTVSRPRLQPLTLPTGASVIAVARIESDRANRSTLSPEQTRETAAEVAELGDLPNVVMVQVDFDATSSERAFYRELLVQLREKLPQSTALSITALASWCQGDNWLEDLPVDEAVPMLFRMGVERKRFLSQLAATETFNAKPCQASAGVSIDEPVAQLPHVQRLYVFNPDVWSPETVDELLKTYQR